ncbi:MAG: helix-hairpin-helix domain-containing protein [Candidatus Aureabacteria bacterium]|nr:helix-hairpin-helix domain-containing protein [Candidatus Auribacterota bacterium]
MKVSFACMLCAVFLFLATPLRADAEELWASGLNRAAIWSQDAGRTAGAPMLLAKKKKSTKKKKPKGKDVGDGGGGVVKIDPNTASEKDLTVLPLVDKNTAHAIVEYRKSHPFKTPDDLIAVPEVGPMKYRIFKHLIHIKDTEAGNGKSEPAEGPAAESTES